MLHSLSETPNIVQATPHRVSSNVQGTERRPSPGQQQSLAPSLCKSPGSCLSSLWANWPPAVSMSTRLGRLVTTSLAPLCDYGCLFLCLFNNPVPIPNALQRRTGNYRMILNVDLECGGLRKKTIIPLVELTTVSRMRSLHHKGSTHCSNPYQQTK